ncbi:amidase family protein, partial [Burkholderia cenocepacia]|uniref:amidase family protein n=1 Tax=Burkholderia cenocepacia TaxID=95486 RepID=UPI002DDD84F6
MTGFIDTFTLGGPGPTIAIKDTIDIAGHPTRAASRALADAPPAEHHADVVRLLLDAGWQIAGKANMHELAFGMTGINDYTGTPVNPQDAARIPGGSSSGSASLVGLGAVDPTLGPDTGRSLPGPPACRRPARPQPPLPPPLLPRPAAPLSPSLLPRSLARPLRRTRRL